jgi:Glycosyl transferase family 2
MERVESATLVAAASNEVAAVSRSVSVAMATYDGAEFLEAQLASIAAQTRKPIELVVCDDGSSDGTVEIVERFARQAPFEVRLIRNRERLGYGQNFMKAARLCRGEVIAWSDQDDVWMPEKLALCVAEFEKYPDVLLVVHSAQIGDWVKRGKPFIVGPLVRYRSRRREERMLRRRSVYTSASIPLEISARGNAYVVSRRVLEVGDALAASLPGIFGEFSGHDTWVSFLATSIGRVVLLPDALVCYRQHGGQVSGSVAPRPLATRVRNSASRPQSALLDGLHELTTRAFFRASVLAQLAVQLDAEAGFGAGAGLFRAALGAQVAQQRDVGFGFGALDRAGLWRRHGEILERRMELWCHRPASRSAVACLARNAVSGDYGRADRGGLEWRLFARDLWRVVNVADRKSG